MIVHGGDDPATLSWLAVCLRHISSRTRWPDYRIYLWNNNPEDAAIHEMIKINNRINLIQAPPGEKMKHPHAAPLQKLYELALKDKVRYLVTMDTDAFPIQEDWLRFLIGQLNEQVPLAGIWRDELHRAIPPYIHPSCACMTVPFIEEHRLRFDDVDISAGKNLDTLCSFTRAVLENDKRLFKLVRSNVNQFHYLMGGVYGDLIYHHGAGSRKGITFWGEEKSEVLKLRNKTIHLALRNMLFTHERQYLDWLTGKTPPGLAGRSHDRGFHEEVERLKEKLLLLDAGNA